MERNGRPRRTPRPPDSITGAAKRYHACAYAFATTLGIPLAEALRDYHGPITAIYIEVCRGDLRLPAGLSLPPLGAPLTQANGQPDAPTGQPALESAPDPLPPGAGEGSATSPNGAVLSTMVDTLEADVPDVASPPDPESAPLPTRIPSADNWPCSGYEIAKLKPAQLHLVLARAGFRAHNDTGVLPLLAALQIEWAQRLERGRKAPREG